MEGILSPVNSMANSRGLGKTNVGERAWKMKGADSQSFLTDSERRTRWGCVKWGPRVAAGRNVSSTEGS